MNFVTLCFACACVNISASGCKKLRPTKQLKVNVIWKIYHAPLQIHVINYSLKLLFYLHSFSSMLTCRGHTSCEQLRGTLNFYKDYRNVRHYLPRRLENKMCGTLLFLCFRNLILVRISAYAATQIWLGAMSFSLACSWNDGTFHRTRNTFAESKVQHCRVFGAVQQQLG